MPASYASTMSKQFATQIQSPWSLQSSPHLKSSVELRVRVENDFLKRPERTETNEARHHGHVQGLRCVPVQQAAVRQEAHVPEVAYQVACILHPPAQQLPPLTRLYTSTVRRQAERVDERVRTRRGLQGAVPSRHGERTPCPFRKPGECPSRTSLHVANSPRNRSAGMPDDSPFDDAAFDVGIARHIEAVEPQMGPVQEHRLPAVPADGKCHNRRVIAEVMRTHINDRCRCMC